MGKRRILVAILFVVTSGLAFGLTYLLLQSVNLAVMAFGGVIGLGVIFAQPFIGLIVYLLFLYIRPQDYVPGMMGMPIMLLLGVLTFALMVVHMAVKERRIVLAHAPQNYFLLWFVLAIGASHMARVYIQGAIDQVIDFIPVVMMYFLIANLVDSQRRLRIVVRMLVLLTLILAAQGVVQYFTGAGFGGQETYKGRIQAVGIFSDPNDLALALLIALPFVFLKLSERANLFDKAFAVVGMSLLVYALYLTGSRGGLLSFAVLMTMLFGRRFGTMPGFVAGALLLVAVMAIGPRMSSISTEEASAYGRIQAWGLGIDLLEQYPLFGVGAGQYTEYHFRTAHNSFVLCGAELGFFGLYPWVMMIYLSIKNNQFIVRHMGEGHMQDAALYVDTVRYGLIAFALAAYFLSRTYSELLFILVGLSAAVIHMFVSGAGERYRLLERRDFVYGFVWTIVGWLFTKVFLYLAW